MKMDFKQVAQNADDIVEWFKSYGLRVQSTRLDRYAKSIHDIASTVENNPEEGLSADSEEHVRVLYEFGELSVVYDAFKTDSPEGLDNLLKKILAGPVSHLHESEKNAGARNFLFEANLGSRLRLSKFPVSFKGSGDVESEFNSALLYFQCKRLLSVKQTRRRISAACKQLRKDYERHSGNNAFGAVGLDITKVTDNNKTLIHGMSVDAVEEILSKSRKEFITKHIESERISYGKKTLGILIRNSCVCLTQNNESFMFVQGYTFAKKPNMSNKERIVADEFFEQLTTTGKGT